jgi:hypothetical protein
MLGKINYETGYFDLECRHSESTFWFKGCPISIGTEGLQLRQERGVYHTFVDSDRIPNVDWGIYYDSTCSSKLDIVCHELTHYLQDYVGVNIKGGTKLASLTNEKIPIPSIIKRCYARKDWVVEAEALYLQTRPDMLMKLFDHYGL